MIWLDLGKKKEIESINVRDLDDLSMRFLTHVFHDGKDKISKQINSIFFSFIEIYPKEWFKDTLIW